MQVFGKSTCRMANGRRGQFVTNGFALPNFILLPLRKNMFDRNGY